MASRDLLSARRSPPAPGAEDPPKSRARREPANDLVEGLRVHCESTLALVKKGYVSEDEWTVWQAETDRMLCDGLGENDRWVTKVREACDSAIPPRTRREAVAAHRARALKDVVIPLLQAVSRHVERGRSAAAPVRPFEAPQQAPNPAPAAVRRKRPSVFIGHGHAHDWKDLRHFLDKSLRLKVVEFNSEPPSGLAVSDRLAQMLSRASFAFLVMTAEDQVRDGSRRARENVVHEIGLFQGKLGWRKAIVLVEDGCDVFSNLAGTNHISFPPGKILSAAEAIREVLEREKILPTPSAGRGGRK